ncbi:MAG: glycogen/starch/alpha-glucan phosphorylase [Desulfobacterales bacterium]|nr:glycogen/starch/alpha-glucan phosphorylase [Desulfobacterales bacterium]
MDNQAIGTAIQTNIRTSLNVNDIKQSIAEHLFYTIGKPLTTATPNDYYLAVAYTVRDHMLKRWIETVGDFFSSKAKAVCYFSAEFLTGPHLGKNLVNLEMYDTMNRALKQFGLNLDEIIDLESEPGLGNGGLGRLAACYMESLATLGIPAIGFGIRYEFGIFNQQIIDGWQVEYTDKWLRLGNPWEIPRPERIYNVKLGGYTQHYTDSDGRYCVKWIPGRIVRGMAYDTPVLGYKVPTSTMLRLWKADSPESFDFQDFNRGDYYGAVEDKVTAENLSKVLYPNDEQMRGKLLRLEQQYFFISCSLQNLIEMHLLKEKSLDNFHEVFAAQLNDTHPSVAVAELMHLLLDEHKMDWDKAWNITQKTFAYTNHTLLPEALEKWSLPLFASVLPRHLEIIYEINHRFLHEVIHSSQRNTVSIEALSLIDENGEKFVRMANLACVGSYAINGVAELHTELLKKHTLKDFYKLYPQKFSNKTNGVTPRRWMMLANYRLSKLITETIGDGWIKDLEQLKQLEAFVDDKAFQKKWHQVKYENKAEQSNYIFANTGVKIYPDYLFDVQVKRIHEYKRQHLNLLHIITLYHRIKQNPNIDIIPRVFLFGGKSAPGYSMAKLIIKLINSVAHVVNNDPDVKNRIKVVFIPNFNVKLGQRIYPIADLSEQISTAGKEASGTGNMKFSMNGALTIGTLDGANIEIREEVKPENFFLFGLKADEIEQLQLQGYHPYEYYHNNQELKQVIDLISSGYFSKGDIGLFRHLVDSLMFHDSFMLFADYQSYIECQEKVDVAWRNRELWTRMSILNTARMGKFSSDRAIREYCKDIWKVCPRY